MMCCGQQEAEAAAGPFLQDGGGPDQAGQEVVHLHLAAAGEQGDEFPSVVGQGVGAEEFFPGYMDGGSGGDVVHQRVAVVDGAHALGFEVRHLEGEDDEGAVHVFLEKADAALAPGPDFRRDVVEYLETVLMGEAGYL